VPSSGIADVLPDELRAELLSARRRVAQCAKLDDSHLLPACQRYTGECYQTGAVAKAVALGAHVLVISGGYGVVLATESIGWYCRMLHLGDWDRRLLERCIEVYARQHDLRTAVAFLARTGSYANVVRRWAGAGVDRAYLVSPDTVERRTSQKCVTRAYGEALSAYLKGTFTDGWSSADGVRMDVEQVR